MALSKASTDPNYIQRNVEDENESTDEIEAGEIDQAGDGETEGNESTEEVDSIKPPDITKQFDSVIFELHKKLPLLSQSDYMGGGSIKVGSLTRIAGFVVTKEMRDEVMKLDKILKRD